MLSHLCFHLFFLLHYTMTFSTDSYLLMLVSYHDDHLLGTLAMWGNRDLAVCQYIALTHYTDGSITLVLWWIVI